mmetsp:Transcript_16702/g.36120  ORF Transcript_16702/g.36120 Transcript_16702/m.36120 type:complete len:835 (+) Transcript_16702:62-2566(+)
MAIQEYHLRCELRGHDEDVRGVLSCDLGILTSSRDKTLKLWVEESDKSYTLLNTMVGHTDYAGPLAYMTPGLSAGFPQGAVVSGSRDKSVILWDPVTAAVLQKLEGHMYQVSAVGLLPGGEVVSASLDKTLRVWRGGKCVAVLEGHEAAVLSLAVTPSGDILSGSGDATIRLWSGLRCAATFRGHTDSVRALDMLPGIGFVSGSHDFTLRVWDMSGQTLSELLGHTALVFAVAALGSSSLIASGSEDNTVRIWQASGQCVQTIKHPGCIWDVAFTLDGDLVTGCSDSVARVWSKQAQRKADAEVSAAMTRLIEEQEAAATAAKQVEDGEGAGATALPPGVKVEEAHMLMQPGTKAGQTKIVRENDGSINAYAWDAQEFKWEKIGEVVAGPKSGGATGGSAKKFYNGREWDYVFDVDVEDGAPARKLPYDRSENPYIAAERFLEDEGLPAYFKEQVVQFILQNTGQSGSSVNLAGTPITGGFCDPFTGGSSSSSAPPQQPTHTSLPGLGNLPITGGGVDPFTGGSTAGQALTAPGQYREGSLLHVPARAYMTFDMAPNPEALGRKLREFNTVLQEGAMDLALGEQQAAGSLDALLRKLPSAPSSSGARLSPEDLDLVARLLRWPAAQLFPALDVARLVVLDAAGCSALSDGIGSLASGAAGGLLPGALTTAAAEPTVTANQQLALRLLANCFKHTKLREWVIANRGAALDAYASCSATANKAVRLSMATLLHNYAVYAQLAKLDDIEAKMQVLSALLELLGAAPTEDVDSVHRSLVAVGTLVLGDAEMCSVTTDLGIQDCLRKVNDCPEAKTPAGRKMLEAALDVMTLLKQGGRA